ncbi:MAG: RNA polymerase sigma factor RpoD/SigA [bacterium]
MRQLKISKSITNRETASLDYYLNDIAREELVSADEEVLLAQRIKSGDQAALEKLCKANLRFVVSVAKQYQNQGLSLPDLINEGNLGLIKAAQRFDETRGFKFISYGVWWIRQSILQGLAEQSRIVRLPLNKIGLTSKINKAYSQLEQHHERPPTDKEIGLLLEISEKEVNECLSSSRSVKCADAPIEQDETVTLFDVFIYENDFRTDRFLMRESLEHDVQRSLATLGEKERDVINSFYGIGIPYPLSLDEIAKRYDLTRERVRQIKEKALRQLKHSSRSKLLKSHLG